MAISSPMVRTRSSGGSSKEKGRLVLAWISFGFAVVGGAAVAATFIGGIIAGIMGFLPGWVAIAAFAGAAIAMGIDLFVDSEPNQTALVTAIMLPSLARAVPGRLSDTVTQAANNALSQVQAALGEWLGASSAIGVAIACCVISLLMGRRVVSKGGGR